MNHGNLYGYDPSIVAAVIFVILFTATTGYHIWQLTEARCWYFIPFVIGGIFQIIGYICRVVAHNDLGSVTIYALQSVMTLLASTLYAASIYMVLGRLVAHLNAENLSLVPVKWMTKIFVAGDILSFLMQSAGGGLMASKETSTRTTGSNVVIGGLVVQLLFFGFFVVVAAIFHVRINKYPTTNSSSERQTTQNLGWKQRNWATVLMALYVVSILILVRSIFRLIEYKYGFDGYIMTHEVFSYIFDALIMFIAMVVMNLYHPAVIFGDGKNRRIPGSYDIPL
ncbi:RTA-like protein [Penicillium sp. IBT 16267x]|nr:RTA-like protein [Penicillium sp. IBT 16267x]